MRIWQTKLIVMADPGADVGGEMGGLSGGDMGGYGGGGDMGGMDGGGMGGFGGFGGLGIGNPGSYGGQQSVGAPGFAGGYSGAGGVPGYGGGGVAGAGLPGWASGIDMTGWGGFGGLGIGNPGSYGGQQSVGAPGFSGGYSDAGGVSGYTGMDVAKEFGSGLVGLARMLSALKNPAALASLPDNMKSTLASFDAAQAMLGTMGLGTGAGLSSGVTGGERGGDDPINQSQAGDYLASLVQQNQEAGLGTPTTMEAILKSMYSGSDPQFNLPQMMGDYTSRVTDAAQDYTDKSNAMADEWKEFEGQFFQVQDDYTDQMNDLPALNMILPTGMGGGSVPLAPGAWAAIAGDKASRRADILSQALPAMANRSNIPMNQYTTQMGTADALMRPFDTAMSLYELDKRIQGNLDVAEASKPEKDEGSLWDSLIPAAGYVIGGLFD